MKNHNQRKLKICPTTIRTLKTDDLDRVRGGDDVDKTISKRYCTETAA